MDPSELAQLIASAREDETVELKRALPRGRRHLRTLGAFANGRGGTLIVGVNDAGEVVGVHDPRAVRHTLEHELRYHVRPRPPAHVLVVPAPPPTHGSLVVVRVQRGPDGPYAVRLPGGRWQCYVRERDQTMPLPERAVDQLANPDRKGLPADGKARETLLLLAEHRWLGRADIARTLNLSQRRTARILTALVRAGLAVEHKEHREPRFVLTPQGRALARNKRDGR